MKKVFIVLLFLFVLSGCGSEDISKEYSGSVTDSSKKYLDKGYTVNILRDIVTLGDDAENIGKGYIRMKYNVVTDYYSTNDIDPDADYNIKKKIVSNVRVIKGPKKGMADELIGNYSIYEEGTPLLGTNNKYETVYDTPHTGGVTSSIAVGVNKIALFDSKNYEYGYTPSLQEVYGDLGISREDVTLTLGFRVELITNGNKTYYKDYEIVLPPSGFDITGEEFQMKFVEEDVKKMEPFLEK